jgi:hypothetical protein
MGMSLDVDQLYDALGLRAVRYGIAIQRAKLADEVPGEFDGPTIKLNQTYDALERTFYLAHSIGSIAEWSFNREQTSKIVLELRNAKGNAGRPAHSRGSHESSFDSGRLDGALAAYLAFESRTWERAVWLLKDIGHEDSVTDFTNFGRADMESMRIFHTTGKAPVWREFFEQWNEQVRNNLRTVEPFVPRPIPAFRAIVIPKQEIVQEEDGKP